MEPGKGTKSDVIIFSLKMYFKSLKILHGRFVSSLFVYISMDSQIL